MFTRSRIWIVLILLSLALAACSSSGAMQGPSGSILFQDDFSAAAGGWNTLEGETGSIRYENGGLRLRVDQPRYDLWSVPSLKFGDVRIEVDVTKAGGPDDNDIGVLCRYKDEANFYGLLISSDGYYGITKMENGEHNLLGMDAMQVSDAIRKGDAANHLTAECIGDRLALSVNGQKLVETQDSSFASGDVGVIAGSFDTSGVDVVFDNFLVSKP